MYHRAFVNPCRQKEPSDATVVEEKSTREVLKILLNHWITHLFYSNWSLLSSMKALLLLVISEKSFFLVTFSTVLNVFSTTFSSHSISSLFKHWYEMLLNPSKIHMASRRSKSRSYSDLTRRILVHALNSVNIATWFSWSKSVTDMFISTGRIRVITCGRWAHFTTTIFKIFFWS